jgi:sugar-specific transcriptional regulator TrmB
MDERLIHQLETLNFNPIEAKVYIELLKHKALNGSQIAKKINASRSSVYSALNQLYHRGVVFLIPGDTNMYKAENPEILIDKMKALFEDTTQSLKKGLLQLEQGENEKKYYNLSGTQNFINKVKTLLLQADKEVYMNSSIDLQLFKNEFEALAQRGVRIIVFTFDKMDTDELPIELYTHPIANYNETQITKEELRLMLVIDLNTTLICSALDKNVEMTGTFTDNPLLVHIVSEHIHHDIYLSRLKESLKKELIDESVTLDSLLERKMKE